MTIVAVSDATALSSARHPSGEAGNGNCGVAACAYGPVEPVLREEQSAECMGVGIWFSRF